MGHPKVQQELNRVCTWKGEIPDKIIERGNCNTMKIECPSCHLVGKINELELPPEGRHLNCPRCKNSFHVVKPPDTGGNNRLMNSCPSCHYATFTDEMFTICPKCGLTGDDYQEISHKQQEREQLLHDQEILNRSFRNPDLVKVPTEETVPERARVAQPVAVTAWLCIAVGGAFLCYGIFGLVNYYSKDWQAVLSEPSLEPVSKLSVFFSLGFIPWLVTLFSIYLSWAALWFLKLRGGSHKMLTECAWAGFAVVVTHETVNFINWVRVSSSTPSLSYYAVGVLSSLLMIALFGAPFIVLLWYLKSDMIIREFKGNKVY
jgi:predicted Zn finger-like uncharacterized protein